VPCANAASDGRVPATAVRRRGTCRVPAMDLACTCQVPQAAPSRRLATAVSPATPRAPPPPGPDCKGPSAQRAAGSARHAAGLPGALMALAGDLHVLDEHLPETEHDSGVDVIVTYPGHAVWHAAKPKRPVWDHLDPAKMSAIPALKNHLARPHKTDHRPRDADTRSGCQFASQHASPCAFLLRPVPPAPLFTLADANLTLPMGSQTDTSRRSIERLSGASGRAECGAAPERLTQRRPHAATGEGLRWAPGRSPS
jgi:hypothetical protein